MAKQTFDIGDRVRALRPLSHGRIAVGALGRVVGKSMPSQTSGPTITIQFQGVNWLVRVPCLGYVEHAPVVNRRKTPAGRSRR
jgi:hypothetical protein